MKYIVRYIRILQYVEESKLCDKILVRYNRMIVTTKFVKTEFHWLYKNIALLRFVFILLTKN